MPHPLRGWGTARYDGGPDGTSSTGGGRYDGDPAAEDTGTPKARRAPRGAPGLAEPDDSPLPADEEDDERATESIRIQIVAAEGIFVVYDVPPPESGLPGEEAYVAFWNDYASGMLHVLDHRVYDEIDVGHALRNLERDLNIETAPFAALTDWLYRGWYDAGKDPEDPGRWVVGTYRIVFGLWGFELSPEWDPAPGEEGRAEIPDSNDVLACVERGAADAARADDLPYYATPIAPSPDGDFVDFLGDVTVWQKCGGGCSHPCCFCPPDHCCAQRCCIYDYCCHGECCKACCSEESDCCAGEICCPDDEDCCPSFVSTSPTCCEQDHDCCGSWTEAPFCCPEGERCCGSGFEEAFCCPLEQTCCWVNGQPACCDGGCCGTVEDPFCCPEGEHCCGSLTEDPICCPEGDCCGTWADPFCCLGDQDCCWLGGEGGQPICCAPGRECCFAPGGGAYPFCCADGKRCCYTHGAHVCCPPEEQCCGVREAGFCCPPGRDCCYLPEGQDCCPTESECCGRVSSGQFCCSTQWHCCYPWRDVCCPPDSECCGHSECCSPGQECCAGECCPAGEECCWGKICCPVAHSCSSAACCPYAVCGDGQCCYDANACTDDLCVDGACEHPANSAYCNDGDPCTVGDTCSGGTCVGGTSIDCNDGEPCTDDVCDDGACYHVPRPECDGGTPCPGGCNDGNECTIDSCDDEVCTHTARAGACMPDANPCTQDVCMGGLCVHPVMPDGGWCPDDGNLCTSDWCLSGTCSHPNKADCTGCPGGSCISGVCETESCTLADIERKAGCPGSVVLLEFTATCQPNCPALSISVPPELQPDGGNVAILGGSVPCDGMPHTLAAEVSIDVDAPLGEMTFAVLGEMPQGATCQLGGVVDVFRADIDGDADHDAVLLDVGPDDDLEDTLPGVIVLCNQDDDDADGAVDHSDAVVNGGLDDVDDFTPVVLHAMPDLPVDWTVRLTLESPTNVAAGVGAADVVRVFSALDAGATPILGPGLPPASPGILTLQETAPHGVDLDHLRAGDIVLAVEGLQFAGEVKLKMELLDDGGAPVCVSDTIQLKVAPLLLLGHLDPPTTSYVSRVNDTPERDVESTAYCTVRFPDATPSGVSDVIIPPTLNDSWDPWAQDEFQIGYQESPEKAMYIVLDSKRDRGLQPFPPSLLGPDFGHIQIDNGMTPNTRDAFGNLEVSPPSTAAETVYPFGRVYYGDDDNLVPEDRIDAQLRTFLVRQAVQSPVSFDTTWLRVGHVDEFMSIVPNAYATNGWTVLLADPVLALDILQGDALTPNGVDRSLHIPRYDAYQVVTLGDLLDRTTSDGLSTIKQFNAAGGPVASIIDSLHTHVSEAFGLIFSEDTCHIPVLFDPIASSGVVDAITPDLVNGTVYGTTFIAPDPFLHGFVEEDDNTDWQLDPAEDDNGDNMLDTLRDPFQEWTKANMPDGITVTYVDNWLIYHLELGEVHCGSNDRRNRPTVAKWWEYAP